MALRVFWVIEAWKALRIQCELMMIVCIMNVPVCHRQTVGGGKPGGGTAAETEDRRAAEGEAGTAGREEPGTPTKVLQASSIFGLIRSSNVVSLTAAHWLLSSFLICVCRKTSEDTWVSNNTYWELRKDPGFSQLDFPILWWHAAMSDAASSLTQAGSGDVYVRSGWIK